MKKILYIFLALLVMGCDSENAINCIQTTGKPVTKEFEVPTFSKIFAGSRVKLYLTYGDTQKVVVKTGKNLLNDVSVSVDNDELYLKNKNACNLVRDYKETAIYVTSPNITVIRNGSPYTIESTNTLKYPELTLLSEDEENEDEFHTDGDFKLDLESHSLKIVSNKLSNYYLSGTVADFSIQFLSGDGWIKAENLVAQHIAVFHRGTSKIVVNPKQSLTGKLVSTGDLIAVNHPPVLEVEELYTGKLIFQ